MLENNIFDDTEFLEGEILEQVIDLSKQEQEKVVEPRKEDVVVEPDSDMQVLSKVTVKGVTAEIDENIKAENIRLGATILGVEGNVAPDKPDQEKTIYPSEEEHEVVADIGFELAKVIAKPVLTERVSVIPAFEEQVVTASEGKYIKEVVVGAVEDIEPEIAEQETLLVKLESTVDELEDISDKTINITENGEYDVKNYGVANVNIPVPDLSQTTASADNVMDGKVFYNANGELTTGTYKDMLQARVDATNSCEYLFYEYRGTELNIKNLDTRNVTNMGNMFYHCLSLTILDLSSFDTSKVTSMSNMFNSCKKLTSLDLSSFNTSNVTEMGNMFNLCTSLTSLDLSSFNTSNVTNMYYTFQTCSALTDIIGTLDMIKVKYCSSMFNACQSLTNVTLKNIKKTLQIGSGTSYGTLLTDNTIINTFKELWDLTGSTSQTLTLSTPSGARTEEIYVKLVDVTDEMLANDPYAGNKKPCVVCESTDDGAMTLKEYGISKNWAISY